MKTRNELYAAITFTNIDHWIENEELTLEHLGLYTALKSLVNRSSSAWTKNVIPQPLNKLAERLKLTMKKFRALSSKLYEFGLLEYVEYDDGVKTGNKPRNVVVNDFPLNQSERDNKPYEKVRCYTDYVVNDSACKGKGGRPAQAQPVDMGIVPKEELPLVPETELNSLNKESIHKKDSLKSFVNKSVDNSDVNPSGEESEKDKFRSEVMDIAHDYYFEFRQKYGMTKDGFIRLFTKFTNEKIEDGSYKTIRNLKAYMAAVVGNIEGHKFAREYFESREILAALDVEEEVSEFDRIAEEYRVSEEARIAEEFKQKSTVDEEFLAEIRRYYSVS